MSSMATAYNLAAFAVRQRFAEQHPEHLDMLNMSLFTVAVSIS